ncbi:hypothetical protein [Rheinheimera fenheensis]|uniref:hypothetical protein n=1 Tax=Rheinheimera fenheensis TaxID=3152295 RepID=UPI003261AB12
MIKKLKAREWINYKDNFEKIVLSCENEKLQRKWKKVIPNIEQLSVKETRSDALKELNKFFQSLPDPLRKQFLRTRNDSTYEESRKKIRLLRQTLASLESIMEDQKLKNYDAAVNHLLANYDGVK